MPVPISASDIRRLRADAAAADSAGWLGPRQQALLHRRGWLTLLVPAALGGAETPLPAMVRFEEALARIDGSTAWVLTLCAGALWFSGFLAPAQARKLLTARRVCWAGSGALAGTARREGEGWRLQGDWPYASGAPMATHFTLNARLLDESGMALCDAGGEAQTRAFILPAAQVRRRPGSWHAQGLRATASERFAIDDIWVPSTQAFQLQPGAATAAGPLYRFPFLPLAYATLGANLSGLALQFLDAAEPALQRPRSAHLRAELEAARSALDLVRARFYAALDAAWAQAEAGTSVDAQALNEAALALVAQARAAVAGVYTLCGLRAADPREALNRAWRDFHTASQHAIWLPSESPACASA